MRHQHKLSAMRVALAAAMLAPLAITSCASPESSSTKPRAETRPAPAAAASTPKSFEPTRLTEDPIVALGHGAILTNDGSIAEPSLEFIRSAQRYYMERLLGEASQRVRGEFEAQRRSAAAEEAGRSEIAKSAADIAWLLERVAPDDAPKLASINTFLAAKGAPGAVISDELDLQPLTVGTLNTGKEYVKQCEEAGVPIPPPWGSNKWVPRGRLDTVLISTGLFANVYVAESTNPRGICIALPRSSEDGGIPLFGVICQGNDTNKACFWDNEVRPIDANDAGSLTSGNFIGGAELYGKIGGVCTDCHRGENVFIVHPGTPLDLTRPTQLDPEPRGGNTGRPTQLASGWVEPLVHPAWPQNPEPPPTLEYVAIDTQGDEENPPDGSCLTCHNGAARTRLGELSGQYCTVIRLSLMSGLMPPRSFLDNLDPNVSFSKHVNAIEEACGGDRITPPPFGQPTGGAWDDEIVAP